MCYLEKNNTFKDLSPVADKDVDYEDLNYYDMVYYFWLSQNQNALRLLKQNQNKINWNTLSYNESIFKDEKMPFI